MNSKLKAPTILASQTTASASNSNVSEAPSTQTLVRDIRDATTVKEVRDIMNQVKSKYRNTSQYKYSNQQSSNEMTTFDNLRI